jgi:uncharacterized membrane protein YjjP (DUF1212 family)
MPTMQTPDTAGHPSLEEIAMLALDFGRALMEAGASARLVDEIVATVANGLGAERVDLRIGYASLAITIGRGADGITRMRKVGALGVNQRLDHRLRELAATVGRAELTASAARSALTRLIQTPPRHPGWVIDVAVGGACACFGRLLGLDWSAVAPVFLAAALGQWFRRQLAARHVNVFIGATLVAFVASVLSGVGAALVGSLTVDTAMIASVLLLVPGVPSLNAQNDILEGRPTLGSARAVWVVVILVFLAAGVWLGQTVLGLGRLLETARTLTPRLGPHLPFLLHQSLFGGLAAMGFGVLFSMGRQALLWCGAAGALALAVRTTGLAFGWSLESASFVAALAVGSGVQLFQDKLGVSRNTLGVAGCIPMIPGGFAAKAILGLFALTQPGMLSPDQTLITSVQNTLRVMFTVGAMGTGLAIPSMLLRVRRLD